MAKDNCQSSALEAVLAACGVPQPARPGVQGLLGRLLHPGDKYTDVLCLTMPRGQEGMYTAEVIWAAMGLNQRGVLATPRYMASDLSSAKQCMQLLGETKKPQVLIANFQPLSCRPTHRKRVQDDLTGLLHMVQNREVPKNISLVLYLNAGFWLTARVGGNEFAHANMVVVDLSHLTDEDVWGLGDHPSCCGDSATSQNMQHHCICACTRAYQELCKHAAALGASQLRSVLDHPYFDECRQSVGF
jgi:hypothetical protein